MGSDPEERMYTENDGEQGAEEDIWTKEKSDTTQEKTAL
jgi:hypothetical protein